MRNSLAINRFYFFASLLAIVATVIVSFTSLRVRAAAETLNCDGNSRTIFVGTYTDTIGNQFSSGADLTLAQGSGACTFTITQLGNADPIDLSSLTIQSGVTLTHAVAVTTDGTYNKIDLDITGDVLIESGASIDVSAKGLRADSGSFIGYGIYSGTIGNFFGYASSYGSGGSHGGPGGLYTDFSWSAAVGPQYDSVSNPIYPGGSGSWYNITAIGGGVLRISATNITVSGTISANAATIGFSGEGAGGTIYLNASSNISGDGTLTANGGGNGTSYGGGGGGRIALHYANISSGFTLQAKGGDVSGFGEDGGAGTIYKKPANQDYGDLILDNGSANSVYFATELPHSPSIPTSDRVATYGSGYVFKSVNLSNNAVLNVPFSLDPTGTGALSRSVKFYIVDACDPTDLDTLNSNGQLQWNLTSILSTSGGSNYTCVAPQYIMEFALTTSSASESVTSGSMEISAIGPAATTTFVDYSLNLTSSTATGGGVDFTLSNGTATFDPGDTTTTVSFTVVNDTDMESDETIVVALSNPMNGVVGIASSHTYTIEDNDTPGITTDVGSGVNVTEGSTFPDTYSLVLDSLPLATVTIRISSDTQVTTTVESIEFTPSNWSAPQSVSVLALNDNIAESSHSGTISHTVSSTDPGYEGFVVGNVNVSISDNDFAGATVTQLDGSTTVSENGVTDTYTLVLNTIPSHPVTINIFPNSEVTVSTSSIVFNTSTWNVAQTITISAVDDEDSDPWDGISISHSSVSDDTQYNSIFIGGIFGTVIDNETPAVTVRASGGTTRVREGGTQDTFTVNLETEPSGDVRIVLSDGVDLTSSPDELTFTALNWEAPQTVTVTAVNDGTLEGSESPSITFTASSTDSNYHNISINSLSVMVYDNDGITVTQSGGATSIAEGGATDSFDIVLDQSIFSNVTIFLTTSTQYSLSTTTLYFHSSDWSSPQTVTITAVDDVYVEGNHTAIVSSTISTFDFRYSGTIMENITVNITDNDEPVAGVTVSQSGGTTALTEAGQIDTYTIVLDTMPASDVTIEVTPDSQSTVSSSSLIFTSLNWNIAQTLTVTAVNDFVSEGGHSSTISHVATSPDGDYEGISIDDVVATITDNDTAGITVSTISASTTEAGGTASFTVVFESEPTGTVVIPLSSSDTTEGTLSTSSLTFNPANWSTVRTVVVNGVDDNIDDGNIPYTINIAATSSTDPNYHNVNPTDVSVENMDNDTVGVTITQSSGSTSVTEGGATDTYTIALATEPIFSVTVEITADSQSTVSTSSIVFSTENWDAPQTITVTADNDNIDEDSPHTSTITHDATSADALYQNVVISSVTVNITDNDTAGLTVLPLFVTTTESGVTSSFTVVLDSRPLQNVQINMYVSDSDEVSISTSTLMFNPSNWSVERTVVVTGIDDLLVDGNAAYMVVVGPVSSTDPRYGVIDRVDVTGVNIDDETVEEAVPGTSFNGRNGNSAPSSSDNSTSDTPSEDSVATPFVPAEETIVLSDTERKEIVIGEAVHHVTRVSATDLVAVIILESDPITLTLEKNKIKRVDTDGDKQVDLSVTYLGLINGTPKFVFATIAPAENLPPIDPQDTNNLNLLKECILLKGNPYKLENSPVVYLVDVAHNADGSINSAIPCAKRAFANAHLYFSYFESWKHVRIVDSQLLAEIPNDLLTFIPVGPRRTLTTGSLIKVIDDPKVYLIIGPQKYWIQTEVIFRTLGYLFSWVDDVTKDTLNSFGEGPSLDKPVRPAGTIIRYPENDTIYRVVNKGSVLDKEKINPTEGLSNYNKDRIVTVSPSEVYPRNPLALVAKTAQFTRFLSVGSSGQEVVALQNILRDLGYLTSAPNGYFGSGTREAVLKFQKDRGIDPKGHVGPATREALNQL